MSNILVAGLHKSGTTGLYRTIKEAVAPLADYAFLFEPKRPTPLSSLARYAPHRPVLTKVMVNRFRDCALRVDDFDHRFMTVRDPRDIVVSRLLFRPLLGSHTYQLPAERLETFIEALEEKECDPASHSVWALHELADELGMAGGNWKRLLRQMDRQLEITAAHDVTPVAYEDFVAGRLGAVSERLGITVTNPAAPGAGRVLDHVKRSMGHGEWRHWFTAEDVDAFRRLFGDRLAAFGHHGWELADEPSIDPAGASGYIQHKVRPRLEQLEALHERPSVTDVTADQVAQLRGMAEDGRSRWAVELARVHLEGEARWRDPAEARRWAREAAVRGHAGAMGLLADLLATEDTPEALAEARHWRCEHDRLTGRQVETIEGRTLAEVADGHTLTEIADGETLAEIADGGTLIEAADGGTLIEAAREPRGLRQMLRRLARLGR